MQQVRIHLVDRCTHKLKQRRPLLTSDQFSTPQHPLSIWTQPLVHHGHNSLSIMDTIPSSNPFTSILRINSNTTSTGADWSVARCGGCTGLTVYIFKMPFYAYGYNAVIVISSPHYTHTHLHHTFPHTHTYHTHTHLHHTPSHTHTHTHYSQ